MADYINNTPDEPFVIHISSADTANGTLIPQQPWDNNGEVISKSRLKFDAMKYLGKPIENDGSTLVAATVTGVYIPFTFHTMDERNNDIFVQWANNAGEGSYGSSPIRVATYAEKMANEYAGIPSGTRDAYQLMEALNRCFLTYTDPNSPLYKLRNVRFVYDEAMWASDYTDGGNMDLEDFGIDGPNFLDRGRLNFPCYYFGDETNDNPGEMTFTFATPPGAKAAAQVSLGQWGVNEKTVIKVTPVYRGSTPTTAEIDASRFNSPYATTMFGNRFQAIDIKCDFLSQLSSNTNILCRVPVTANPGTEITMAGLKPMTHLLNKGQASFSKFEVALSDLTNLPLNLNNHHFSMTIVFNYLVLRPVAPPAIVDGQKMYQMAKKRARTEQVTGQQLPPPQPGEYMDVPNIFDAIYRITNQGFDCGY